MTNVSTSRYPEAYEILEKARREYPRGDNLDPERFVAEIEELLHVVGLIPSGDLKEEYFLELSDPHVQQNRRRRVKLDHVALNSPAQSAAISFPRESLRNAKPIEFSDRFIALNLERLITDMRRVARIEMPLHSRYCRGAVRSLLDKAIRNHCPELVKRKHAEDTDDVIGVLRNTRFRSADHQQIRELVEKTLIPELKARANRVRPIDRRSLSKMPTAMAWRQTLLLELEKIFRRYAPPGGEDRCGMEPPLKTGTRSYFIRFVCAVLAPFVREGAADPSAVNQHWREIRQSIYAKIA